MGHAMDSTLQDILIRFKRMQGYAALWVPGTDHAGIATQIKVEEELRTKEGLDPLRPGPGEVPGAGVGLKRQYGGRIVQQQKKLGASCDWDRARFTMDEGLLQGGAGRPSASCTRRASSTRAAASSTGAPHCVTALSDAEVEYQDKPGSFWHIRLPHRGGGGPAM